MTKHEIELSRTVSALIDPAISPAERLSRSLEGILDIRDTGRALDFLESEEREQLEQLSVEDAALASATLFVMILSIAKRNGVTFSDEQVAEMQLRIQKAQRAQERAERQKQEMDSALVEAESKRRDVIFGEFMGSLSFYVPLKSTL